MNERLKELAKQARLPACHASHPKALERFAELICADEREACVTECWVQMGLIPSQAWTLNPYEQCAKAIQTRGDK
jgi:hypothetical protein